MQATSPFTNPLKFTRSSIMAMLAACSLLLIGMFSFSPAAHASGSGAVIYVHTATAANSAFDYTMLDNSGINGNPNAILVVTPNWNPFGFGGTYDNHSIGVFYSGTHWYIFHQDLTAVPVNAAFNIYAVPGASDLGYEGAFVQTATSANSVNDYTIIDAPSLNGQPTMRMLVTPNWNPGGVGGVYENHPIGVFYNTSIGRWCIFNQDLAGMPQGASFNVNFASTIVGSVTVHTATPANSAGDYTIIDYPTANNNPQAILLITPNWNPGGVGGVYENHNIGVFYSSWLGRWCIFNQDLSAIPNGASFNVYFF